MSLKITEVLNHTKTVEEEQVQIAVLADDDLRHYALVDNSYDEGGGLANVHPHFYKFPKQPVKKGDTVIVHTGKGINTHRKLAAPNASTTYNFFCGSENFVWNDAGDTAKLYRLNPVDHMAAPVKLTPLKTFTQK